MKSFYFETRLLVPAASPHDMRLTFIFSSHYTRKQRSFWRRNKERKTDIKKQRKKEGKKVFVVYFSGDLCVLKMLTRRGAAPGTGQEGVCAVSILGRMKRKSVKYRKKTKNKYMACVVVITETSPSCPEEEP